MAGFRRCGRGDKETVGNANGDRANVLKFRHATELFSPPGVRPTSPCKHIYGIASDRPLPWEAGHQLRRVALGELPALQGAGRMPTGVVAAARRQSRVNGNANAQEDTGHGR